MHRHLLVNLAPLSVVERADDLVGDVAWGAGTRFVPERFWVVWIHDHERQSVAGGEPLGGAAQ